MSAEGQDDWRDELVAKMDREWILILERACQETAVFDRAPPCVTIYNPPLPAPQAPWETIYRRRNKCQNQSHPSDSM